MTTQLQPDRPSASMRLSEHERVTLGRDARRLTPRSSHAGWTEPANRQDPVSLLEGQNASRIPWLVPVRHARMRVSPFTFYRGTACIMAADLATTPSSGLHVQLGGDAHLSNFGAYASPERQLVFDANDFDETLAGPWEWDLKRLATSFTVAAMQMGFDAEAGRTATLDVVRSYREAMARFARMGFLELWYDYLTVEAAAAAGGATASHVKKRVRRFESRAQAKTNLQALAKLTQEVDGKLQFRSAPPLLVPVRDLPESLDPDALGDVVRAGFEAYKESVGDDVRGLVERYTLLDMAVKVVGVGSVGTRCFVLLLEGRDRGDPLFLQIKEAGPSVLEDHLGPSRYPHSGRRVVEGQRMVQSQSDIFLGWSTGREQRAFYVRQLRDWKGSADESGASPRRLAFYARLCGLTLARGHARSGDPVAISAYAGKGDALDTAVAAFAADYARQNLRDYATFIEAIAAGRLEAAEAGSQITPF